MCIENNTFGRVVYSKEVQKKVLLSMDTMTFRGQRKSTRKHVSCTENEEEGTKSTRPEKLRFFVKSTKVSDSFGVTLFFSTLPPTKVVNFQKFTKERKTFRLSLAVSSLMK